MEQKGRSQELYADVNAVSRQRCLAMELSHQGTIPFLSGKREVGSIHAMLIIFCIALGVAIPNIFFRRMIIPKHEQMLMDLLSERK